MAERTRHGQAGRENGIHRPQSGRYARDADLQEVRDRPRGERDQGRFRRLGGAAPRAQRRRRLAFRDGVRRAFDARRRGIDCGPLSERHGALLHGRARLHVRLRESGEDRPGGERARRTPADCDDAFHRHRAGRRGGLRHGIRSARISRAELLPAQGRAGHAPLVAGRHPEECRQRTPQDKGRQPRAVSREDRRQARLPVARVRHRRFAFRPRRLGCGLRARRAAIAEVRNGLLLGQAGKGRVGLVERLQDHRHPRRTSPRRTA